MRIEQILRAPLIAVALLAAAGCNRGGESRNGMTTDVNLSVDAAANDVLGGNEAATNEAATNEAAASEAASL